jgi:hypothetical protein
MFLFIGKLANGFASISRSAPARHIRRFSAASAALRGPDRVPLRQ